MALAAACATVSPAGAGSSGACGPPGYAYAGVLGTDATAGIARRCPRSAHRPSRRSRRRLGRRRRPRPGARRHQPVDPGRPEQHARHPEHDVPRDHASRPRPTYAEILHLCPERPGPPGRRARDRSHAGRVARLGERPPGEPDPIFLAGSHAALTPMALGESWDGGRPACNRFRYRFQKVWSQPPPAARGGPSRTRPSCRTRATRSSSAPARRSTPPQPPTSEPTQYHPFTSSTPLSPSGRVGRNGAFPLPASK